MSKPSDRKIITVFKDFCNEDHSTERAAAMTADTINMLGLFDRIEYGDVFDALEREHNREMMPDEAKKP